MKRRVFTLLASLAVPGIAALLGGCGLLPVVSGSGTLSRSVHQVEGFTAIQASQAFHVRLVPDPAYSVTVTCDDNLPRYLVVEPQGTSCLRLGLKQGYTYLGVTLEAEVHMPEVRTIDASGASKVTLDAGFSPGSPLTVVLSGASVCEAPAVRCGNARFDLSGASLATCSGTAGDLSLVVSGASRARLLDLAAGAAQVNLSGASEAWVDVGGQRLDLAASGASTLYYGGTPALALHDLSGGSRAVKVR